MSNSSLARNEYLLRKSGQKDTHTQNRHNKRKESCLSSKDVIYTVVCYL